MKKMPLPPPKNRTAYGTYFLSTLGGNWNANVRFYMMRGNCGRRRLKGNSRLILRTGRSVWWIEAELQIRFRLDFRFEFRILTADDGIAGFSRWERNWVVDSGRGCCTLTIGFAGHRGEG